MIRFKQQDKKWSCQKLTTPHLLVSPREAKTLATSTIFSAHNPYGRVCRAPPISGSHHKDLKDLVAEIGNSRDERRNSWALVRKPDQVQRKKHIRRGDPKSLAEKVSSPRCGIDELTHLPARNTEWFFRLRKLEYHSNILPRLVCGKTGNLPSVRYMYQGSMSDQLLWKGNLLVEGHLHYLTKLNELWTSAATQWV